MYGSLPSLIFGFHGCDKSTALKVISGKESLKSSNNPWDWLGDGIYFFENDPSMALEYAKNVADGKQYAKGNIKTAFVLGAVIDLKHCWNLPTTAGVKVLKKGYGSLLRYTKIAGMEVPKNIDFNQRYLDAAVIEHIHVLNSKNDYPTYDSVRGAFREGNEVYEGTDITEKNHIQICVRNPNCIKGFFLPLPVKRYNPYL